MNFEIDPALSCAVDVSVVSHLWHVRLFQKCGEGDEIVHGGELLAPGDLVFLELYGVIFHLLYLFSSKAALFDIDSKILNIIFICLVKGIHFQYAVLVDRELNADVWGTNWSFMYAT